MDMRNLYSVVGYGLRYCLRGNGESQIAMKKEVGSVVILATELPISVEKRDRVTKVLKYHCKLK